MVEDIQVRHIGTGLYTPREAALFAKLRTQTLNRWFFGNAHGGRALTPRLHAEGVDREERVLTFEDLIQAVAVRNLRKSAVGKIELPHIREVVDACENIGLYRPLAKEHTLYWYSNRLILLTETGDYVGLKAGVDKSQFYAPSIIEPYLQEIKFIDGLAHSWTPLESGDLSIRLDSDRRFGMPMVEPHGILVSALTDAVNAEGSIEAAAESFEIETAAVLLALKYQEYLMSAA